MTVNEILTFTASKIPRKAQSFTVCHLDDASVALLCQTIDNLFQDWFEQQIVKRRVDSLLYVYLDEIYIFSTSQNFI